VIWKDEILDPNRDNAWNQGFSAHRTDCVRSNIECWSGSVWFEYWNGWRHEDLTNGQARDSAEPDNADADNAGADNHGTQGRWRGVLIDSPSGARTAIRH
jgi:hypothetical protein